MTQRLEEDCCKIPALVHPRAFVGKYATIRKGCIIGPMAVVNSGTEINEGTLISAGAIINNNVLIGAFSHINVGAIVKAQSVMTMFTEVNEGEIYEGIHMTAEEKKNTSSSDDFIKKHFEQYGVEPNLFDGVKKM